MPWTPDERDVLFLLVGEAWPGEFSDEQRAAWTLLLDAYDPTVTVAALRALVAEGHRFRPSVSEFVAAIHRDPSRPTFDEAFALIFGPGGILRATPTRRRWATEAERRVLVRDAIVDRARSVHPLVGEFVVRQGVERLRQLPIHDPTYGEVRRKELRAAWDEHVTAFEGRHVAALAAGAGDARGLRRFDPLAALPALAPDRHAIEPRKNAA